MGDSVGRRQALQAGGDRCPVRSRKGALPGFIAELLRLQELPSSDGLSNHLSEQAETFSILYISETMCMCMCVALGDRKGWESDYNVPAGVVVAHTFK